MASYYFPLLKALGQNADKIRKHSVSALPHIATMAPLDTRLDYAERFELQLRELVEQNLTMDIVQSMPPRIAQDLESGLDNLFNHLNKVCKKRLSTQRQFGVANSRAPDRFPLLQEIVHVLNGAHYPVDLSAHYGGETGVCLFDFTTEHDASCAHSLVQNVNNTLRKYSKTISMQSNSDSHTGKGLDAWIESFGRASSDRLGKVLDTVKSEFDACESTKSDVPHKIQLRVSSYESHDWESQKGPNICLLCPKASVDVWQLGRCDIGSGCSGNHTRLCTEVRDSSRFSQALTLTLYEDSGSFETSSSVVNFKHRSEPTSLERLIKEEFFSLPIIQTRFGPEERRALVAKLALHLSTFCPWWRHASAPWDDTAVHFFDSGAYSYDRESPFVVWQLGGGQLPGNEIDIAVLLATFTSFAKLLLEVEFGPVNRIATLEYSPNKEILPRSLRNIHGILAKAADPITHGSYMEAVWACLGFHQKYKHERSLQAASQRTTGLERPQDTYQRLVRSEITSRILKGLPDFDILSKKLDRPGDTVAENGEYPYGSDSEPTDDDDVPRYRDVPEDSVAARVPITANHFDQPVLKRKVSRRWDNLPGSSPSDELEESPQLPLPVIKRNVRSGSNQSIIPRTIDSSLHVSIKSVIRSLSDENGHLFDHEAAPNSKQAQERRTDKWFNNFIKLLKVLRLGEASAEPLKVAILDSGFNLENPEFNTDELNRVRDTKSFVDDEPNVDKLDHGTFIATIILRLSVNVDLYIAKITNTDNPDVKTVAKALKYARTTWEVDMISLSFGFDRTNPSDGLFEEIKACLHKDIIVFASASNDGAEGSRTYPAKFPGVICVHSSDQRGKKSDFNPTPRGDGDLSFIGEHVRPTWGRTDLTNTSQMDYRDGTSYATPVAVAFAAFMIGFIHTKGWAEWPWLYAPSSPIGVKRILEMMSGRTEVYRWVSPTRFFKYTRMEFIEIMLKETLVYDTMESRI
ncbi:hypothetical protein HBI24_120660 [Parastagonospora nodorum]|nr:hypothetical protein HBI79_015770 [Parastagonospora nodorum]KAH5581907.1 hypothetical protein HBI24_120660 [Parastagonospora nodorum]